MPENPQGLANLRSHRAKGPRAGSRKIPGGMIDRLEPRLLMAVPGDAELRWMVQAAGGTWTASPALSVTTNLTTANGYPKTTNVAAVSFSGTADPAATASVKVNNVPATYTPGTGAWSLANAGNAAGLSPGINRVQVRSYSAGSVELTRKTLDVWYDDGSVASVSGTLSGNNTWTANGGPYLLTGTVTVTNAASLTIQPGASVYFASGAQLVVRGTLNAQGTDFQHIRMTRDPAPASPANWADLEFRSTNADNRLAYVDLEYASAPTTSGGTALDQAVRIDLSRASLDHVHFANIGRQYLDITGSSIDIRHSVFPGVGAVELVHYADYPATATASFDGNVFGTNTGYSDVIDFTGGQRPGNIVRFVNNTFLGSEDDGLDLDSADAWIENNVFMHFHQPNGRNTPSSKAHAISTGEEDLGDTELTIVRNYFYDVDHAVLIKDAASATIVNNTIVGVRTVPNPGPSDATSAVFNLYEVRSGQFQATRVYLDGNIIQDAPVLFELPQPFPSGHPEPVPITMNRSVLPVGWAYPSAGVSITPGVGNTTASPKLLKTTNVIDPRAEMVPVSGSSAFGLGPNGVDAGAAIPSGASLSGAPPALTNSKGATLAVGFLAGTGTNAAGYTAYKYKLDDGAWSAEIPTATPITLSNLADGGHTIRVVGKADDGIWQPDAAPTTRTWTVDTVAPKVTTSAFRPGSTAPAVALTFSEDVSATLAAGDVVFAKIGGGAVPATSFAWNPATLTATWAFASPPADGDYRAAIASGSVADAAANALDGDNDNAPGGNFAFDFFALAGDVTRDRAVDFADLVAVAQHYDQPNAAYADGDLTGDGIVDFADLVMVAQNYDHSLAVPGAVAAAAPAAVAVYALPAPAPVKSKPRAELLATPPAPVKKTAPRPAFPTPSFATRKFAPGSR